MSGIVTYYPKRFLHIALPIALALGAAGCSEVPPSERDGTSAATVDDTLAGALNDIPDMATLSGIIAQAEFGSIFEGPGAYTILAPKDAAFEALGPQASQLNDPEQRPVVVALLRDHILPGQLTRENIAAAIESNAGPVTMTTLGGNDVTFSSDGNGIVVDNGRGSQAMLAGDSIEAKNGAIIPLDAVLLPGTG